jgi:NADH-quinone oxidoreductase subunit K
MCLEQLLSNNSLFFTGLLGILYNRNSILIVLMGIEMALLGINLNFISFSILYNDLFGQIFALFILTVAAAEASIGLAIIIAYFKVYGNILISDSSSLIRN